MSGPVRSDEIGEARDDWHEASDRFGSTGSVLDRITAPETPWRG